MAAKGSRKNPYTWSEYTTKVSANIWPGGWVQSGGELTYRSHSLEIYTGMCAKSYPVPETIFNEMTGRQIWSGGWVLINQNETKYYDCNGTDRGGTLGEAGDPCPLRLYGEMVANEIWEGGWIQESNGTLRYVPGFNIIMNLGEGSGNGNGSGFGSVWGSGSVCVTEGLEGLGCSISAGSYLLGTIVNGTIRIGRLHVAWTEGMTIGLNELSAVTFSITPVKTTDVFNVTGLYAVWVRAYELSIGGSFTYTGNDAPTKLFHINTSFIIPEQYRNYD